MMESLFPRQDALGSQAAFAKADQAAQDEGLGSLQGSVHPGVMRDFERMKLDPTGALFLSTFLVDAAVECLQFATYPRLRDSAQVDSVHESLVLYGKDSTVVTAAGQLREENRPKLAELFEGFFAKIGEVAEILDRAKDGGLDATIEVAIRPKLRELRVCFDRFYEQFRQEGADGEDEAE